MSTADEFAEDQTRAAALIDLDSAASTELAGVLKVGGEVDLLTTPLLKTGIEEQLARSRPLLVIDLTGVSFLGSSGLAALVEAREAAQDKGTALRLVAGNRSVFRPLATTGLSTLFDLRETLEEALAAPI
ncbi:MULTISPECIES: STAS domain-containing protein [unclassified Crossiella]|uniref:STAS domain-containing protein n=1 Tax=Crossiella sp. CA-258035 TaxID=2981138 RepID=UPI0024BD1393|nr:STAS domain-containing protein [Crossiella sp. CA-258035]WHT17715.1 STAS domain-containing protein [Crossiella sp. CA-258035]